MAALGFGPLRGRSALQGAEPVCRDGLGFAGFLHLAVGQHRFGIPFWGR